MERRHLAVLSRVLATAAALSSLWSFTGGTDGSRPAAAMIADEETGALYGTTERGGNSGKGSVFKIDTIHQTLATIWSFSGSDGAGPDAPLLADESGAFYGTTYGGGASGKGTVFKLTPPRRGQTAWTLTTLWSFTGGSDGANPQFGPLIADERGALYGTANFAGDGGFGTVFKLSPPSRGQTLWGLTALWSFTAGNDGGLPLAGVIADKTGALYGTANLGGSGLNPDFCGIFGCGVVFKLTPPAGRQTAWTETTLWNFANGADGGGPVAPLLADDSGALYGTTTFGGNLTNDICGPNGGCGVVFKLTGTGFVPKYED